MEQTQSLTASQSLDLQTLTQPPSTVTDPRGDVLTTGTVGTSSSQNSHASSNQALSQNMPLAVDSGLSSGDEIQDFEDDLLW